jgi:hypothetical protein
MDIISGDRNGYFNVFITGDSDMTGYKMFKLMDSTVIDVGANSQPAAVDWNGDGKKDLLLGREAGQVLFYRNQTSDSWPMFQACETLLAANVPIVLSRVNPYVFDLDRDGVHDLICGANDGYVRFYRNTGSNAAPELAAAEILKLLDGTSIRAPGTYYYGSRCGFGYWDADTLPDFLLSAYDGTVALYRGALLTGVEEGKPVPVRLALRAEPNPFTTRAVIHCESAAGAELVVCDGVGRVVRHLGITSGRSEQAWDGRNDLGTRANSGVYFCRLTGSGQTASARIVLSR